MKKVRKLICLALAMVMALAMCVTVYAAGETNVNPKGSITVTKASKGETYTLVKLFDATYNTGYDAIVYKLLSVDGSVPDGLGDYFEVYQQGGINYVKAKAAAQVSESDKTLSEGAVKAITSWAKGLAEDDAHFVTKVKAEGNTLTFSNLDPGYYVVISRSTSTVGGVVSVNSLAGLTQEIADKTTSDDPGFTGTNAGKKINGKDVDTVAVGESVTYTVTYKTVNWMYKEGKLANEKKVTKYVVEDTLPDFLDDVTVTDVTVEGTSIKETGNIEGLNTFGENGKFTIPWVDNNGNHRYNNNVDLVITYTATVNKNILNSDKESVDHKNEITIKPYSVDEDLSDDDDKSDADVYTCKIVVQKYAAKADGTTADNSKPLANAKFILARKNPEDDTRFEYAKIDDSTGVVAWDSDKTKATTITTESNGEATFVGLKNGTYYLEETEAPVGYNKLNESKEVIVSEAATENITQSATVVNKTGTQLPSTGGIGTTIFYVVGAILVIGAGILLVAKKRMSNR